MIRMLTTLLVCIVLSTLAFIGNEALANIFRVPTLSSGDIVTVEVENEPELTVKRLRIPDRGSVDLPLIGEVELKWKSLREAEALITELYFRDYLKQPKVKLTVNQFRPIYIDGNVNIPGSFEYTQGMTVSSAIEQAGGFTTNATPKAITLLVETSVTGPVEARLDDNVMPGDVITVE